MAQGLLKSKTKPPKSKSAASGDKARIQKRGGARAIRPKQAKLAKQAKLTRKLTAGLITETERMLGARVGHLEIVNAGKGRGKGVGGVKSGVEVQGQGQRKKKAKDLKFRGKSKVRPGEVEKAGLGDVEG